MSRQLHRTAARRASVSLALWLWSAGAAAASPFDPVYRFRVLPTDHFIIYFHQGEDHLAARLAAIAEDGWQRLRQALHVEPPALTHVVLVDQSDAANGWAFPLPYNTIVLSAAWPAGSEFLSNTEDWLRLVFTHEFTHIVHLDRSEGWARAARRIFGRAIVAFPNLFVPLWQIEGLATYAEGALTGEGRLHAGDFRAIVDEAARARAFEPLDRVNGGLTDWPNGFAHYAYGVGFHAYLADRFGADRFAALAEATARRVPFTASRAFKHVYGRSLGDLWRDYEASVAGAVREPAGDEPPHRLTHHGFVVAGPRFALPACATCAASVIYSVRTPHGFPALNQVELDESATRQLTTRYLGSTTAVGRETIYFDQQELRRNAGLYSDLYAFDRRSERVRRITRDARLLEPDLSPDGQTLVCVQAAPGRRDLVIVRSAAPVGSGLSQTFGTSVGSGASVASGRTLGTPVGSGLSRTSEIVTLVSEPDTQFNAPRWSPDGRAVVAERHRPGARSEIVVVDVATRSIRVVASDGETRIVTPAWRPDGRAIVAAADVNGAPFNLYEFSIDEETAPAPAGARQLTHTTGGATWPDVSADGTAIVFVGYTVDGFDVFTMPYPSAPSDVAPAFRPAAVSSSGSAGADLQVGPEDRGSVIPGLPRVDTQVRPYSPWATLKPTSWWPIVDGTFSRLRIGASTGGVDVLGYHAYTGSATWLVTSPSGASTPGAAVPDWEVAYAYNRWQPTLWLAASTDTSFYSGLAGDGGIPPAGTRRERQLEAGAILPVRHARRSQTMLASIVRTMDMFELPDRTMDRDRTAVRGGWAFTSAQTYGYSISPEHGLTLGVTAEAVRRSLGSFDDATTLTVDARVYAPAWAPHHVVAVRVAAGTSSGNADAGRTFHLGGPAANSGVLDFTREAVSLLRGFPADAFAGRHVMLLNADYRWPLARPQRGVGTVPLFLHTVHATLFGDAGHAWTGPLAARDLKTSFGAELSFDLVAGYGLRFTATLGTAWGRDGRSTLRDRPMVYGRFGHAF